MPRLLTDLNSLMLWIMKRKRSPWSKLVLMSLMRLWQGLCQHHTHYAVDINHPLLLSFLSLDLLLMLLCSCQQFLLDIHGCVAYIYMHRLVICLVYVCTHFIYLYIYTHTLYHTPYQLNLFFIVFFQFRNMFYIRIKIVQFKVHSLFKYFRLVSRTKCC